MPQVTVVPADHLIIVDGAALVFPFDAPTNLHALQWRGGTGHTEWTDGPNKPLTAEDYDEQVVPYVKLWQAEKARLEKKAAEEAAARALPDAKSAKQKSEPPAKRVVCSGPVRACYRLRLKTLAFTLFKPSALAALATP